MQNKQLNPNPFKKQLATCPFNSAHTFEKDKLVFHISRCKDKQKRMPYMAKCKYNPMHYVDKNKLQLHEEYCSDRQSNQNMVKQFQTSFRNAQRQDYRTGENRQRRNQINNQRRSSQRQYRSRSRDRKAQQTEQKRQKIQKIQQDRKNHLHDQDEHTFSDCQECQNIVQKYKQKIKLNPKISKLIKKYETIAGYSIL